MPICAVQIPLLQDVLIILCLSVAVILLFYRFRLPAIIGFLVTGVLIGPNGLSLISATHEVELLAEVGVILLLFVIGLELSLKQLIAIRRTVFVGGALQVGLTIVATLAVMMAMGYAWNVAVFFGFLFSLSSTAVVLRLLQEKNEINAPHGRISLGVLIFQDIVVVPMMLLAPILAGKADNVALEVGSLLLKTGLVLAATYVGAKYIVPRLFYQVAQTRSKELFILSTIALCFVVAFLTSYAGLSLALGAFLAGLIISESEYSHQATSNIIPFRELFTSFFFVSIGMLLDLGFLLTHILPVIGFTLLVMAVKTATAGIAAALLRYPFRIVILSGLSLFQVGEFAFILSKVGITNGLITDEMNQYFLSVSILTMCITPFVLLNSEAVFKLFIQLPLLGKIYHKKPVAIVTANPVAKNKTPIEDHMVIIGYGLNGQNLSYAARYAHIPTIIVELNYENLLEGKAKGEHMVYGDATQEHILHETHLDQARVVVIAISDPQATKTVVANIRSISKTVYLIVRTRFVKETNELLNLGADEVIPEEFETSIEIFARALHKYLIPLNDLEKLVQDVRADNYQMFRPRQPVEASRTLSNLPDFNIECMQVIADSGEVVGKSIAQAEVRKKYSITILALNRNGALISNITPETRILQNDVLYVSGSPQKITSFYKMLS
ncbi:MAG TPA: monovalent cation:proton antiporter-2 (CPA2) family protein [Chitinophagales bacterium]|nr:monovalent cation:proton antiporter-2 (CPA2) family protein [Chitinophagales bacterium]